MFYLFSVLRYAYYLCISYIVVGSWKGSGNQYIQLVKAMYCKLPTSNYQLSHFRCGQDWNSDLRGEGLSCYHCTTMAHKILYLNSMQCLIGSQSKLFKNGGHDFICSSTRGVQMGPSCQ